MDYNYSYGPGYQGQIDPAAAKGLAIFGIGIFVVVMLFVIAVYVYSAICVMRMAKKTNTENAWMAWIPIFNLVLLIQIARKPLWWIILFFIPLVNIVMTILVWMGVSKELKKPEWIGVVMIIPIANLVAMGYLAFSKEEVSETPKVTA